jgi:hypothetical protein
MAGSSPAMTKKRKVDDARRPATANAIRANDWAVVDVLGSAGTGEAGGFFGVITTVTATSGVPEPSTWTMMLIGFAGVGFAGYRKARSARTALSAA